MITLEQIKQILSGMLRIARFDARGVDYFENTADEFLRSFYAALIVAPPYAILLALETDAEIIGPDIVRFIAVRIIAYVTIWVAYPLFLYYLTRAMDCAENYLRYIAAYNWTNVLIVVIMLASSVLVQSMVGPEPEVGKTPTYLLFIATAVGLGVLLALFAYNWFVAKTALAVSNHTAFIVVISHVVIASVVGAISTTLTEVG
jgi:hypothetical protein